ncbi:MAG: small multi-drug export protein, partial [Clostridia bacterium]|nr:small multi-drug export protein [Clostridia bacterium]
MAETLANAIVNFFGTDGSVVRDYFIVFFISLLPILELRGGLIAAYILGLPLIPSMIVCYIGNMIPIPFLLMFVKRFLNWLGKFKIFQGFVNWIQNRGQKKADEMKAKQSKWEEWGLMAFVAIPLPGTGGWTGSLVAALLNIDNKKAFKVIAVGVAIAGIIVAALSYGLVDVI